MNSYSFSLDGKQQGSAKLLTASEIEKINIQEVLDIANTGTIGANITSELFNPSKNGGGYTAHDSQTRHVYDSSAGIIISKNALTTGSDLRNFVITYSQQ